MTNAKWMVLENNMHISLHKKLSLKYNVKHLQKKLVDDSDKEIITYKF